MADDHPLYRHALKYAVSQVRPDCEFAEAASVAEALGRLQGASGTSLVLLDLRMPDCAGLEGLTIVRSRFPRIRVVAVADSEDGRHVRCALALGAAGCIPKSASMEVVVAALETILEGGTWAPPGAEAAEEPAARGLEDFTPAEMRILMDLQRGRLNKQIASDIGVTEATVKSHLTSIFRKLGVANRTQAVLAVQSLMDSDSCPPLTLRRPLGRRRGRPAAPPAAAAC